MSGKWLKDLLNYAARNEVELTPEQRTELLPLINMKRVEDRAPSFMRMMSDMLVAQGIMDSETQKETRELMAQMPSVQAGLTQKDITSDKPAIRLECH